MEVRISRGRLRRPMELAETDVGILETPELGIFKLRTSVAVPRGRAMVVGGTTDTGSGESLLVIVRPKVLR